MNLMEAKLTDRDGRISVDFAEFSLPIPDELLAERPALRAHAGRRVILGIRPEDMEDASLVSDAPVDRRIRANVELREALGSDVVVHFKLDAAPAISEDVRELALDVGHDVLAKLEEATDRTNVLARLNPRTTPTSDRRSSSSWTRIASTSSTSTPPQPSTSEQQRTDDTSSAKTLRPRRRITMKRRPLLLSLIPLALIAAACGSDDKKSSDTSAAATTATTAATATTAGSETTTAGTASETTAESTASTGGSDTTDRRQHGRPARQHRQGHVAQRRRAGGDRRLSDDLRRT